MKNASAIIFALLLSMGLILYGPSSMAMAKGGAVFSMEICANGVATTVLIGADGSPVEPAQDCPECLTCCQVPSALTPASCGAGPSFVLLDMETNAPSVQDPIPNKRNKHPAPRGPPAVYFFIHMTPEPITPDQLITGSKTRSDGRPLVKDADA